MVLFLFGCFVEFPLSVEHYIAWKHVCISFSPCLGVYVVEHVAEIVEYVEAVNHESQLTFEHGVACPGIPDKVCLVE